MDTYKRIAYLHQMQSLLNDIHESKRKAKLEKKSQHELSKASPKSIAPSPTKISNDSSDKSLLKLNCFYGHLSKEIAMKHNIQILNCDSMRQLRCKRCFCQYNFHQMSQYPHLIQRERRKSTKVNLKLTCPQCGYQRKVIFHKSHKTKYEQILAEEQDKIK